MSTVQPATWRRAAVLLERVLDQPRELREAWPACRCSLVPRASATAWESSSGASGRRSRRRPCWPSRWPLS